MSYRISNYWSHLSKEERKVYSGLRVIEDENNSVFLLKIFPNHKYQLIYWKDILISQLENPEFQEIDKLKEFLRNLLHESGATLLRYICNHCNKFLHFSSGNQQITASCDCERFYCRSSQFDREKHDFWEKIVWIDFDLGLSIELSSELSDEEKIMWYEFCYEENIRCRG